MNRAIILIDGSNFYFKLKELNLHNLIKLDFSSFAQSLAGHSKIVQATFYVGAVRVNYSAKSKKLHANQQKLLAHLRAQGFTYYLGYLLKSKNNFKEKGVDVKIATDILLGASKNIYDQAFLVSSDSDLIPAINGAQDLGKHIVYVGFKHKPSFALLKNCSQSVLLTKKDLLPFCA